MSVLRYSLSGKHLPRVITTKAPFRPPLLQHAFTLHFGPPQAGPRLQSRGKKTRVSANLADLPQGLIPLDPLPMEVETPAYPTVVLQALNNMRKFENCVLLTRVGGFYELYFEHAEEFGPLLNLKVAQKRTNAGFVSMVPLRHPFNNGHLRR
jgi:MutS domain I